MNRQEIIDALEALKGEVDQLDSADAQTRDHVSRLVEEIETRLEAGSTDNGKGSAPEGEPTPPLTHSIPEAVELFEAEHPRLTGALNRLMVALSGMGI